MTITAALVVFSVTWFLVFFVMLQLGTVSQGEAGTVVQGTPRGAPAGHVVARKARLTTVIAAILSALIIGIVTSGWISIDDIDIFNRGASAPADGTGG